MKKYLPLVIANFLITPTLLADYSVRIPLEQNIFAEPENLTLDGNVTANKTSINFGESVSVSWDYEKLTSIFIPNAGTFYSNSGSANVTPNKAGAINVIVNNRSKSETVSLPMHVIFPPVDIVSFVSSERGISVGDKVNLSWQVDGADSVEITLLSSGNASVPVGRQPNIGSYISNAGGIVTGDIIKYLLTAYSLDGETIKTSIVEVPVRGSMTYNSFTIDNPVVQNEGITIPLGDTLNVSWSGTNIKTLVLSARDTANSNGPDVVSFNVPNPDLNSYSIPMTQLGDWSIFTAKATGFNKFVMEKNLSNRVRVYQPATIDSFTINNASDEVTMKKGTINFAWTGRSPIMKYTISGLYSDPIEYASNLRAGSVFYPYVGDYNLTLKAIDYNGRTVSKNILLHIIP
jgi:hypothetical protein